MSDELITVTTTTDTRELAEKIAHSLVTERLAACVQIIGPLHSVYRWQGEVETADEWQCNAKTAASRFDDVAAAIRELHPYDEPEIVAVPLTAATPSFAAWIRENSTPAN